MTLEEIRKNAPKTATHFIKKPFRKVKYLRNTFGIYSEIDRNDKLICICRDWMFWIKPL